MNKLKICVYTICKNEEFFAERWLKSAEEADAIFVNDTGSTDRTIEILKSHPKVTLIEGKVRGENFRFDKAWNEVLEIIPDDFDFCVRLDMDMMLTCGWYDSLTKYIIDLYNNDKFHPCKEDISFSIFQIERRFEDRFGLKSSRWTALIHSYSKDLKYFAPIHEKFDFFNFRTHIGESIPSQVLDVIHTEKVKNANDKHNFYFKLSEQRFKEFPTYLNYIILLASCTPEHYFHYLNLLDTMIDEISAETDITLSRLEQGLSTHVSNFAPRVYILFLQFYAKKFFFKDEEQANKILEEIKSLKNGKNIMCGKSYFDAAAARILDSAQTRHKDFNASTYIDEILKTSEFKFYDYFINKFC